MRSPVLLQLFLGLIALLASAPLNSAASVERKIPVYYSSNLAASVRQKALGSNLGDKGFEVVVFGKYQDFAEEIKGRPANLVLAPAAFGRYHRDYKPVLQLYRDDKSHFRFVLLSLSRKWTPKNIKDGSIGVVEQVDRDKLGDFIYEATKTKFRSVKTVSKPEDLFPLLVFKSVDFILVSPEDYRARWQNNSKTFRIMESEPVQHPMIFSKDGFDAKSVIEELKSLPKSTIASIGFTNFGAIKDSGSVASSPILTAPASKWKKGVKILVVRKGSESFTEVYRAIRKQLAEHAEIVDFEITKETPYASFKEKLAEANPSLMVLMDNEAVTFGKRFNEEEANAAKRVNGVALMALNLHTILKGNAHISGIAFETPGYTLVTQFQSVLTKPVKKLVTFYRKSVFRDVIDTTTRQLETDGIQLQSIDVEASGTSREAVESFLKANLKSYVDSTDKVDAAWIQLDSMLLNQKTFTEVWLPVGKAAKLPLLTGTDKLVSRAFDFGVFAITPDLTDLGGQAVQMIEAILIGGKSPKSIGVENLLSVHKLLNLEKAKKIGLPINESGIGDVKIIE